MLNSINFDGIVVIGEGEKDEVSCATGLTGMARVGRALPWSCRILSNNIQEIQTGSRQTALPSASVLKPSHLPPSVRPSACCRAWPVKPVKDYALP